MNDFTKEELEMLYHCCRVYVTFSVEKDEKSIRLADKLLSMIDNYCDPNPNKPNFTQDQKNFICYQIGDWYLMMKPLLEGQHNLGYMKEKLKVMVCDD